LPPELKSTWREKRNALTPSILSSWNVFKRQLNSAVQNPGESTMVASLFSVYHVTAMITIMQGSIFARATCCLTGRSIPSPSFFKHWLSAELPWKAHTLRQDEPLANKGTFRFRPC
jgi:hypothetical protein